MSPCISVLAGRLGVMPALSLLLQQVPPALVTHGLELFHGGLLMSFPTHQSQVSPFLLPNKEVESQPPA